MTPLFFGPLTPIIVFLIPIVILALIIYAVYRMIT